MRLGLTCPSFTWPGGDAAIAGRFADVARGADEAGLHSLWVMDHFFQIPNFGTAEEPMLDALSGGRAVLGLGAAWHEEEAHGLGLPFPPLVERFERLEETLRIAKQMWSEQDGPYEGRHYRLSRTLNSPQARPPILIGGSGEKKTLRLVAEYADACNLLHGADVTHKLGVLRAHCERLGRPYEEIEKTLHLRIPDGQSVGESVQVCGELASEGIDHVIAAVPDASSGSALAHLAALAEQISGIIPAGR